MSKTKEVEFNGTWFYEGTTEPLAELLLRLKHTDTRIVVDYGDLSTGQSWGETYDVAGYIGRTTGKHMPILLHNKRSMGGGIILTHCILSVKTSKGKNVLYSYDKNYKTL
jgi:hypothetical protein